MLVALVVQNLYSEFKNLLLSSYIAVFEPEGEKEHEAEYKKIHEDYKNLVTVLILKIILYKVIFVPLLI